MRRILSVLIRVVKLFIDDRGFAAAIVLWLGLAVLMLHRLPEGNLWGGGILFSGLAVILLLGAHRDARRRLGVSPVAARRG
jgi:membrane protein implicated in regulation of membrane protease activity